MNREVKFSVRIHQGGYDYETLRRIWKDADRLGYYSATLYDLLNVPTLECWTTLSALAAETSSIRLTPLVLANTYRHPAVFAKMASTLDVISNGRLEVGIGAGGGRADHAAVGLDFPSTSVRVRMLEESIEMMKRLWAEEEVTFQGSHYTLTKARNDPSPVQKPHPPFLIGGHGERRLFRAVARHADICNAGFEMSLDEHKASLDALGEHCRNVGRDISEIEVSHNTRVVIAGTDAEFDQSRFAGSGGGQHGRGRLPRVAVAGHRWHTRPVRRADSELRRWRHILLLSPVPRPHSDREHGTVCQRGDAAVRNSSALKTAKGALFLWDKVQFLEAGGGMTPAKRCLVWFACLTIGVTQLTISPPP